MQRILVTLVLALAVAGVHAQKTYRCGNTYSQTPCGEAAQVVKVYKGGEAANSGTSGPALCQQSALNALALPDPESAKVASIGKPEGSVVKIGTQAVEAMKHRVSVSPKNEFGAYGRPMVFECYLSFDQQRVLKIDPSR
jgi:hypothetical protein